MSSTSYTFVAGAGIQPAEVRGGGPRYESFPAWMQARYWESAETTRLNSAHWGMAQDGGINDWIESQLPTLRARAQYESRQNATLKGVLNTCGEDVVGPSGPTLQVQSDDEDYNEAAEQAWQEWFAAPTTKPNISGAQMLKLWMKRLGTCGEFVARKVSVPWATGPVALRLQLYHPRHLTNPGVTRSQRQIMGVEFNEQGTPTRYWLPEEPPISVASLATQYIPLPPDLIVHEFLLEDEEQVRGIPWLASALDGCADLRDFDDQELDAARQAADQSTLLYTKSPDAPYWAAPESTSIERRTIKMCPPQWEPFSNAPAHPAPAYIPFREEKHRDLGRPIGMPLMVVRLDARNHSYSSARLDTQNWRRSVASLQTWLSGNQQTTGVLSRLLDDVIAEARFSNPALRKRPAKVVYQWTWPALPHVDPNKEATAATERMNNATTTVTDELAATGDSLETFLAKKRRELDAFEAADVPYPVGQKAAAQPNATPQASDQDAADNQELADAAAK